MANFFHVALTKIGGIAGAALALYTHLNGTSIADNSIMIRGGCAPLDWACQDLMIKQAGKAEEEARQLFLQNKLLEQQLQQSRQQQSNSDQIKAIQLENEKLRQQIQLLIQQQQQLINSSLQRQTGTESNQVSQIPDRAVSHDAATEVTVTEADALNRVIAKFKCKSTRIDLLSSSHIVNNMTSRYKVVCANRSDLVVECRAEPSKVINCYKLN